MTGERIIREGVECHRLVSGSIELLIATSVGPRILGLRSTAGPQLFAGLAGSRIEGPAGPYTFYGGHRLWSAPEIPAVTYAPDDHPVAVVADARGASVLAPVDRAGLEKSLSLVVRGNAVIVDHTITNAGRHGRTMAPWAITQLAPGGTAVMPLGGRLRDEYQADRSVVAWPYTQWHDPLIDVGDRAVTVEATRIEPMKIGTALRREWLAYRLHGYLFVKRSRHPEAAVTADLGATGQIYCNDAFLELKTLGPLVELAPGASATHREVWEIHEVPSHTPLPRLAADLGLDRPSPLLEVVV